MRGTDDSTNETENFIRITPARAGNRLSDDEAGPYRSNHPRACGEQTLPPSKKVCSMGSPPRVRGTVGGLLLERGGYGITPARAGNSRGKRPGDGRAEDHPRACGEQRVMWRVCCMTSGSPPRVRGTASTSGPWTAGIRITPARAGNRGAKCPPSSLS